MKTGSGKIVVAVILIAVAALLILDTVLNGSLATLTDFAATWWPAALVVIGLVGLVSGGAFTFHLILTLVGAGLLLDPLKETFGWSFDTSSMTLPLLFLGIAILLIASVLRGKPGNRRTAPGRTADASDRSQVISAFSGHEARNASQDFQYGEVTAIFGGSVLDLRDAQMSPGGAKVDITALFGGADLIVPPGWALRVSSTPIFGGVDNRTTNPGTPADGAPVLQVTATAIFGGVGIKNHPDHA